MVFKKKFKLYHFELYHFVVILAIIILSQILIPIISNRSVDNFLNRTKDFYRWDVAERIADQTTSSMELLFQRFHEIPNPPVALKHATVEAIDMIFHQQNLQRSVDDFCIILGKDKDIHFYEDGANLYSAILDKKNESIIPVENKRVMIGDWYKKIAGKIYDEETIQYKQDNPSVFHFLIPFSFRGEVIGALYMKIDPDLEVLETSVISSFKQSGFIFSAFIIVGLLGLFLMTTYLLRERDHAQELLFRKREKKLTTEIENRKEAMFVKRIYHAHHKMEKIIGFVKEDLLHWPKNIYPDISLRVNKYMNFIGRVIYGMKTVNPPVQVIRNSGFNTDVNFLLKFIVQNIFRRVFKQDDQYIFNLNLDENCPAIHVNEYVVWEIFEPLINNAIDHNKNETTTITINSNYEKLKKQLIVEIKDDGVKIKPEFLEFDELGIKKIFRESISIKENSANAGYGCYIAYENCRRCGWTIDALNEKDEVVFKIIIPLK